MKKCISMLLTACLALSLLSGCSGQSSETTAAGTTAAEITAAETTAADEETAAVAESETAAAAAEGDSVELIVFTAASMAETLTELGNSYMADNPGVTLVFNFDSSGTLKTQIQEGAECDIFISAGQTQMDQLDIAADPEVNTEGLDFVLEDTRFDILENKVALAVPDGNPAEITSYDDLAAKLEEGSILMAMGNSDVPVGQYTQRILEYYGLNEEDLAAAGCITYGSNVKEVTSQVAEATVDCGIIYQTDAFSDNLTVVDTATAEMCGQVVYPAAVLNVSQHPDEARAFLDYLTGDTADAVFENIGFTPLV